MATSRHDEMHLPTNGEPAAVPARRAARPVDRADRAPHPGRARGGRVKKRNGRCRTTLHAGFEPRVGSRATRSNC